jgi:hypothetical protein
MNDPLGWLGWLASVDVQMSLQSLVCPYTSSRALGNLFLLFGVILKLRFVVIRAGHAGCTPLHYRNDGARYLWVTNVTGSTAAFPDTNRISARAFQHLVPQTALSREPTRRR